MAERLAGDLADRGLLIASGLARGVRSSAHKARAQFGRGRDDGRPRLRDGRNLPEGEQEDFRGDGNARCSSRNLRWARSRPAELPDSQSDVVVVEGAQYNLRTQDESRHADDLVERSGLTSSEVLCALFDLELKGVVGQLPGKQFLKVLL